MSSRGAEVGHMSSYPENGPLAISDVGGDKKKKKYLSRLPPRIGAGALSYLVNPDAWLKKKLIRFFLCGVCSPLTPHSLFRRRIGEPSSCYWIKGQNYWLPVDFFVVCTRP